MTPRPPPDDLLLRPGREDDWPALCRVHDAARPLELEGSCDPRAFLPLDRDPEGDELRESQVVVAERDGRVVGFAAVLRSYIGWLYVDPDEHGRGIGRALLRWAKRLAGEDAWTIALVNNHTARALYASEGFGVLETFEGNNAGYPSVGVKLALDAPGDGGGA